jgi:carbonic anhydrase
MSTIERLFELNREWSERMRADDPEFFARLARVQSPEYLWIGCSDSRVPANQIVGLLPGEVFVHRNVANVVVHTDLNCLSVMQFAVDVLQVKHILVVGHYGCGGVNAALRGQRLGLIDNWLRHVQDVRDKHRVLIGSIEAMEAKADLLCELNVIEQVVNVCETTVVRESWSRGQRVDVHGWIYRLSDGLVRDIGMRAANPEEMAENYERALARLGRTHP